jgi:hypothetical protein
MRPLESMQSIGRGIVIRSNLRWGLVPRPLLSPGSIGLCKTLLDEDMVHLSQSLPINLIWRFKRLIGP